MILGLDISTNTTGYCFMNEDKTLERVGYVDTSHGVDWLKKAEILQKELFEIIDEEKHVRAIVIEDIASKFSGGRSSAKTIIALARFNAVATYILYSNFEVVPIHYNVIKARNLAGCKVPRGVNTKEFVLNRIMELYPEIVWPRMKKKDAIDKKAYDMADSVIVALAHLAQSKVDSDDRKRNSKSAA